MKKKYEKPTTVVIKIRRPVVLLEGSSEGGRENLNPGGGGEPV